MISFLWNTAAFIVALGILVTIHEFGHFWVARYCNVKVERFSIGFGKSLWQRVGQDGTQYSIGMIPLGGYVKMLDSRVDDIAENEQHFAFDRKSVLQRAAIVVAGPVFNFIFAIAVYWIVFLIGTPVVKPIIGVVTPHSIVAQAGIEPGMELKAVAGVETTDWEAVNMALVSHLGEKQIALTLAMPSKVEQNRAQTVIKTLDLQDWNLDINNDSIIESLGFVPYSPAASTTLRYVGVGSAAERAGVKVGDRIIGVDQQSIVEWQQLVDMIQQRPGQTFPLQIERDGQQFTLNITPDVSQLENGDKIGLIGVSPKIDDWPENYRFNLQFGPIDSLVKAINKTGQVVSLTISMLKKLVVGIIGLDSLSGPISIAKGAGATADYGLVYFLSFLSLISINLGIINLVPLPMLDGGHLLFLTIEAVIGRPVSEKVQEVGYRIGSVIIFSLMALAIFNDFARL